MLRGAPSFEGLFRQVLESYVHLAFRATEGTIGSKLHSIGKPRGFAVRAGKESCPALEIGDLAHKGFRALVWSVTNATICVHPTVKVSCPCCRTDR